jgi:hypothetical protein
MVQQRRKSMMRLIWGCIGGAALALLAGCGGGEDAASGGGGTLALTCNTAGYVAGSVEMPTAAQLSAYAGTYNGDEGSYDMAGTFTKTGSATLVVASDGRLTYKGKAYDPSSVCIEKATGILGTIMYFVAGTGHFDVSDKVDAGLGQAWGVSPVDGSTIFTKGLK